VVLFTDVVVSKVLKSFSFRKRLIKCYLQTLLMHLKICSVVAKKCDDLKSEIRVIFDLTICWLPTSIPEQVKNDFRSIY